MAGGQKKVSGSNCKIYSMARTETDRDRLQMNQARAKPGLDLKGRVNAWISEEGSKQMSSEYYIPYLFLSFN